MKIPGPCFLPLELVLLAATAALSGCAPLTKADCDPAIDQNVITKTRCMHLYNERSQDLQLTLQEQQRANANLKQALEAVQAEAQKTTAELQQKQQDYTKLNAAVNAVLANLKAKSAKNAKLQQSVKAVEAQLAAVNKAKDSPSTLEKRAELNALKQRLAELQAQVGG